jgi:DNA-directed RNA polymerase specialized sigma24 family protein
LAHSGNIQEPFWRISDDQGAAITSKYQEQVQLLALEHPEMSQRQIAQRLGCSVGTVAKYYIKGSAI